MRSEVVRPDEDPPELPRYELQEQIGAGASAVVYRAWDRQLGCRLRSKCSGRRPCAHRYADAGEFAEDLRRHREALPIRARPPSTAGRAWKWVRRHRGLSAALSLLLTAGAVAVAHWTRNALRMASLTRLAREADASGRNEEAARLWDRLDSLGDPAAAGRAQAARRSSQEAAARKAARTTLDEAATMEQEYYSLLANLGTLKKAVDESASRELLWVIGVSRLAATREMERTSVRLNVLEADIIGAYESAFRYRPDDPEIAGRLAKFFWSLMEKAQRLGEKMRVSFFETRLRRLARTAGLDTVLERLDRGGTLAVESEPAGASVELRRYEEGPDRRWIGQPVRNLGSCPIEPREIPRGSYVLLLRKPGFRDVRYPLLVEFGTVHRARVRLYTDQEIGAGFVYVPAGTFVTGGAPPYACDATAGTDGFFISRYEITADEYKAFLEDLARSNPSKARELLPGGTLQEWAVSATGTVTYAPQHGPHARFLVSWTAASAYCDWRSEKEGVRYRLPSSTEWEKAARGVDGRLYPWGNCFEHAFAKTFYSRSTLARPEPVGTFVLDESPYGVRDLAGSVSDWCDDREDSRRIHKRVQGGSWMMSNPVDFRAVTGLLTQPHQGNPGLGFRIVRVLR